MTNLPVPVAETSPSRQELTPQQVYVQVIRKMLMDDHPRVNGESTMNTAMINVLNEDAVFAVFLSYITRIHNHDIERHPILDGPQDVLSSTGDHVEEEGIDRLGSSSSKEQTVSPELLASYRATMLLTNDDTSDMLSSFIAKKSKLTVKCLFPIFQPNALGNLRHACRVIDYIMRLQLDDVYEVIGKNGTTVKRYIGAMLKYIEHAPVAELFLTLICKPHNAALMRFYTSTPQQKWQFYRALSDWKVLLVLAEHVSGSSYTESHNIGAADVFIELLDRLSADENGSLLLQPVAHCPELLEHLITTAVDNTIQRPPGQRTAAIKCVLRILQRSVLNKVQGPPTSPYQTFGGTIVNLVPNQLVPLREKIFELTEQDMGKMLQCLIEHHRDQQKIEMDVTGIKPLPVSAVRHTAYIVKVPFTEFRLMLVDALVEVIAHNPSKLDQYFDVNVWRVFVHWFFEYAHTNLYHAAFYQLVFIALRSDTQTTVEILVKKLKLVTLLIEHYRMDGICTSNKGYILQCCNAIRLQAASQAPDGFLRTFLQSHTTWRQFEPELRQHTTRMCQQGLGFNVPQAMRPGQYPPKDTWQQMDETRGIDHGSDYARGLGFVDDVAWPETLHESGMDASKKKKKKKKGGKKKHNSCGGGDKEEEEDDAEESETSSIAASESSSVSNGTTDDGEEGDEEEEGVAGSSVGNKKKNKKKKKKSKK